MGITMAKPSILNPNPERLNVMKKIYIALTVLATAALVSCEKERSFENLTPLNENDIAFTLKSVATRSAVVNLNPMEGVTIPIKQDNGETLFLEENIVELNPNPGTKGAPAYTINVGSLYSTMGVYATQGNFGGDAIFEVIDQYEHTGTPNDPNNDNGWRYIHNYSGSPWPDDSTPVDFYFSMPAAPDGVTFTSRADQKIQFSYDASELAAETPAIVTAASQQDILFSQTSISKSDHDGYLPNGAPVLMYHALTGVKFRTGWANDTGTKTIITGVRWNGLKSEGTCVIDPSATNIVDWTVDNTSTSVSFIQQFNNAAYSVESGVDGTQNFAKDTEHPENNKFGDSWYSAAADKNLNNEDGEWTFWFIPQEIDDNVTLDVVFRVKTSDTPDGTEIIHTIKFGELVNQIPDPSNPEQTIHRENNVKWEAGQLRTYTLKPIHVAVELYDTMDASKYVKSNLHITNTGNVDQYVRVYIIGNWFGKRQIKDGEYNDYESVLMGYTDDLMANGEYVNYTEVARWNDKDFTLNGTTKVYPQWSSPSATYNYSPYGEFDGLPAMGTSTAPGPLVNGWRRHDKFYYYTAIIGPGGRVPESNPLFSSYTIGTSPDFYIADMSGVRRKAKDVHFVMDISVQAIPVPYNGDTAVPYDQAWADALGVTVEKLNDL